MLVTYVEVPLPFLRKLKLAGEDDDLAMYGRSSSVPGPNSEYGGAGGSCKLSRMVPLLPSETRCKGSEVGPKVVSHCSPSPMAALFLVVSDLVSKRFKSRRDGPDVLPPAGLLLLLVAKLLAFS